MLHSNMWMTFFSSFARYIFRNWQDFPCRNQLVFFLDTAVTYHSFKQSLVPSCYSEAQGFPVVSVSFIFPTQFVDLDNLATWHLKYTQVVAIETDNRVYGQRQESGMPSVCVRPSHGQALLFRIKPLVYRNASLSRNFNNPDRMPVRQNFKSLRLHLVGRKTTNQSVQLNEALLYMIDRYCYRETKVCGNDLATNLPPHIIKRASATVW